MVLHSKVLVPKLLRSFSTSTEYVTEVSIQFPQLGVFSTVFGWTRVHVRKDEFWYWSGRNVFICKASDILELCEASLR